MQDHTWVFEVLRDLELYARKNELMELQAGLQPLLPIAKKLVSTAPEDAILLFRNPRF